MGAAKQMTAAEVKAAIAAKGTLVVDFGATWCGPCQALAPHFEKMAGEFSGKATLVKIDIDQESDLAGELGIMSVPTIMFFKDGAKVHQILGNAPDQIRRKIIELAG